MQLYGCVVLCYANSVIRCHFSPVDLFQLPGDLTELKTDRPSFGIFTHQVRKQARIVFGPFSVQKDNTNLAQRSAPHTGFTSMQCIFPSCCRGRTTDAGSIICPSPKDTRPLWEPGWPPSSHSSHLNAFTAPGADCDGSFPRKSARNSRPAPLGALRPFLILKSKSGRPVSLNPILEPRLRYHLEQTLQECKLLILDGVPTHQDITVLQTFRSYAQEPDSTRSMASHGLRHTYAGEWYEANISLCGPKGRGRVPRPWAGRCDQPLFYVPPKTDREAAGNDFVVPLIFSNVFHLIHP